MKKIVLILTILGLVGCASQVDVKKIVEGAADHLKAKGMTCDVSKDSTSVAIGCEDSTTVVSVAASVTNKVKPVEEVDSATAKREQAAKDSALVAPISAAIAAGNAAEFQHKADSAAAADSVKAVSDSATVAPVVDTTATPADTVAPAVKDSLVVPAIDSTAVPANPEIKTAQMSCYCETWTPIGCQYSNTGNCRCARWRCN